MKETQILQLDYTDPKRIFPVNLLLQKQRTTAKEVDFPLDYFIIDYPILCYKKGEDKLIMVHLADPDAVNRIYSIPTGEKFLALIEPNNQKANQDVQIQILVKGKEEKYILRTISYIRPFEKKENFSHASNWPEKELKFPANHNLEDKW